MSGSDSVCILWKQTLPWPTTYAFLCWQCMQHNYEQFSEHPKIITLLAVFKKLCSCAKYRKRMLALRICSVRMIIMKQVPDMQSDKTYPFDCRFQIRCTQVSNCSLQWLVTYWISQHVRLVPKIITVRDLFNFLSLNAITLCSPTRTNYFFSVGPWRIHLSAQRICIMQNNSYEPQTCRSSLSEPPVCFQVAAWVQSDTKNQKYLVSCDSPYKKYVLFVTPGCGRLVYQPKTVKLQNHVLVL